MDPRDASASKKTKQEIHKQRDPFAVDQLC